jgi:hypothetical protein
MNAVNGAIVSHARPADERLVTLFSATACRPPRFPGDAVHDPRVLARGETTARIRRSDASRT